MMKVLKDGKTFIFQITPKYLPGQLVYVTNSDLKLDMAEGRVKSWTFNMTKYVYNVEVPGVSYGSFDEDNLSLSPDELTSANR